MTKVVGVRFNMAGKIYYFDPCGAVVERGQHVIVETARGMEYGFVVGPVKEVEDSEIVAPLKPIIRIATPEDDAHNAENLEKKKEAYAICKEKIKKHGLEMKLVDAEYTFDNNKLLFYFTADGRIDFRELVKDLASVFKTRIELRQIGVRDEIRLMGGIGVCGRVLCCHSYLTDLVSVSIKMAKEQNLSLNPSKISGVCGRLMCCLKNEEETYEELNKNLPGVGDYVTAEDGGHGNVQSVNVLRQTVRVIVEEGDEREIREYKASDLQFKKMYRKDKDEMTEEDREALAMLEQMEKQDRIEKAEREANQAAEREARQKRLEERKEKKDKTIKAALQKAEKKGPGAIPDNMEKVDTPNGKKNHRNRNRNHNQKNNHPDQEKKQKKDADNAKNKETSGNKHGQNSRHNGREHRSHSNKEQA
ncbi:MAG: stage 0 sporulation protein [Lachnospiraceae bacterium]|nr:stage 0 sporulation protein [Lachnospiraceae bacterium]